jgi:hypothetical protein
MWVKDLKEDSHAIMTWSDDTVFEGPFINGNPSQTGNYKVYKKGDSKMAPVEKDPMMDQNEPTPNPLDEVEEDQVENELIK